MPSAMAARVWPGRTDSMPARTISAAYAARCTVRPISAAANGDMVTPATIGSAKNVHTSTTSTGIARIESTYSTISDRSPRGP